MQTRFNGNVVPFADDATSTNRTVFGGTTQSDSIDDNLNADFKKGWEIVGLNDNPTREDFNAMGYTLGALNAYLYEMGIAEWNVSQNYRINSRVIGSDGKIYKALTGTTGTPNINHNPISDTTNWIYELNQNMGNGASSFNGFGGAGFKNFIINGKKQVNQRVLTSTDNSYNYDMHYKSGTNWYLPIEGDNNLVSGQIYTLSWTGSATAGYYVGTATSATINAQTFTSIANGGNITLTISAGQNLWIKFSSDATGSTYNNVQLEKGSVVTPFEQRPYGLELSLCQRYFETGLNTIRRQNIDTVGRDWYESYSYKVLKRVTPTISQTLSSTSGVGSVSIGGTVTYVNWVCAGNGTSIDFQFTSNWTASADL